jgi:Transposase DDE domain group 1
MSTECSPNLFGFAPVEGRKVEAAFEAGAIPSDAGALLLGATDRAIRMMDRFASCFHDERRQELISTRSWRWWVSGYTGLRLATRISTITTNYATIR